MNNRILSLLLAAAMLCAAFCGCQSKEEEDAPPVPSGLTAEDSDNSFGARYYFQLNSICKRIAPDLKDLGIELNRKDWETVSAELADDRGVGYSSLCNRKNDVTFAAAVENDSGKVMNFGCGCRSEKLKNKAFRDRFVSIAAISAQYTGGYEKKDRDFLSGIFNRLLNGDDDILVYKGTLYIKSVDDETTVLITAPCDDAIIREKEYKEYIQ